MDIRIVKETSELQSAINEITQSEDLLTIRDFDSDCEFQLTYDKKEGRFYFTLVGDDDNIKKALLAKACNIMHCPLDQKEKLTLEDIYDITSLTSASNIFDLRRKIILILEGC